MILTSAAVQEWEDTFQLTVPQKDKSCSGCGDPATGWFPDEGPSLCEPCATQRLPQMLVDVVLGAHLGFGGGPAPNIINHLQEAWNEAERTFWRDALIKVADLYEGTENPEMLALKERAQTPRRLGPNEPF